MGELVLSSEGMYLAEVDIPAPDAHAALSPAAPNRPDPRDLG
jgi:hypothetical protein